MKWVSVLLLSYELLARLEAGTEVGLNDSKVETLTPPLPLKSGNCTKQRAGDTPWARTVEPSQVVGKNAYKRPLGGGLSTRHRIGQMERTLLCQTSNPHPRQGPFNYPTTPFPHLCVVPFSRWPRGRSSSFQCHGLRNRRPRLQSFTWWASTGTASPYTFGSCFALSLALSSPYSLFCLF